jgi:hypothetical protein
MIEPFIKYYPDRSKNYYYLLILYGNDRYVEPSYHQYAHDEYSHELTCVLAWLNRNKVPYENQAELIFSKGGVVGATTVFTVQSMADELLVEFILIYNHYLII